MSNEKLVPFEKVYNGKQFEMLKQAGIMIDIDNYVDHTNTSTKPTSSFWRGKPVLITGADGMVGSTMIDILVGLDAIVYGTVKRHGVQHHPYIQPHLDSGKLEIFEVDLTDYGRTVEIIRKVKPIAISHQAAESFVPSSLQQPSFVVGNNCVSTTNVLEAATRECIGLEGVQLACSSEQYGLVKSVSELPIAEDSELRPTSTYAVTKVFSDYLARAYSYMYKTPTIITRCFNQEGPRRGKHFFTARIATQIENILAGKVDKLVMGNPNSVRDFTHVHDTAAGQLIAIERCEKGTPYNVCSSIGMSCGDYAKLALSVHGLSDVPIYIDTSLLRAYEKGEHLFDGFIGDNRKFVTRTGWNPTKTIKDIMIDGVTKRTD
jgi:GDP-4-dehydro-6-deoxy-D-mannose reductase